MWWKRALSSALLTFAGLTLPLVVFEIYLRLTWKTPVSFYRSDPYTGSWHIPGASGWWEKPCFRTFVRFNSQGLRDTEHEEARSPGTYRIVVLGDSYAEAMQVKLEESFPKVLERELQKYLGPTRKVEVINLGVSGFGTDQELLALRHYGIKYQPDLVLLAFLTGNDVRNNYYLLEERANGEPVKKPYFLLDSQGQLVLQQPSNLPAQLGQDPLWKRVGRKFRTGHWAWEKLYRIRMQKAQARVVRGSPQRQPQAGAVDNGVYLRRYPPEWEEAWRITEALVVEVARESRKAGARFLLVSLTDPFQLALQQNKQNNPELDPERPIQMLTDIARRHGLDYLPLLPLFRQAMEQNGYQLEDLHYSCDGHWTPLGHRLAGEAIARYLAGATALDGQLHLPASATPSDFR